MRLYRRNKYWHVSYYENGKQRRYSLKTTNKKIAERKKLDIESRLITGKPYHETGSVTIKQALDEYIRDIEPNRKAKTITDKRCQFNILLSFWHKRNVIHLRDINPQAMIDFRDSLNTKPITYNSYLRNIKGFLNWTVKRGYLDSNPLRFSESIKSAYLRIPRYYSLDELDQLWKTISNSIHLAFYRLLANTGLRLSELMHIEPKDVDLKKRIIRVRNKKYWTVKTYQERTVPLNNTAVEIIKSLPKSKPYIFPVYNPSYWGKHFRQYLKQARIKNKRLADLRHTFGSHHALANTNPFILQKIMGHANISTTQIYVNLKADDLSKQANNINL